MHARVTSLLDANDGIFSLDQARGAIAHSSLEFAVAHGHVLRIYPQIFIDPALSQDRDALIRAALAYAGRGAVVSHTSALHIWQLPTPEHGKVHLTTPEDRHLRGTPWLRVHRRKDFTADAPDAVGRRGVPVIRLERTIVDSWPLLDGDAKRAPAITAVNNRMTTPARLTEALDERPRIAGRRLLAQLIELLAAGCRSQLELWSYAHVFRGPGLRHLDWQVPISLGPRTVYLDTFDRISRVNFELDGATHHTAPLDRERDLRRDAALAALGITVVRFTPKRLRYEATQVRDEALAILAAHRRQAA